MEDHNMYNQVTTNVLKWHLYFIQLSLKVEQLHIQMQLKNIVNVILNKFFNCFLCN
jgi:hypothetical protein